MRFQAYIQTFGPHKRGFSLNSPNQICEVVYRQCLIDSSTVCIFTPVQESRDLTQLQLSYLTEMQGLLNIFILKLTHLCFFLISHVLQHTNKCKSLNSTMCHNFYFIHTLRYQCINTLSSYFTYCPCFLLYCLNKSIQISTK